MSVGSQIKKARLSRNLTQKELADLVGVTKNAITNYERDYSSPKESVLYLLIRALHVDANYLFIDYLDHLPPIPDPLTSDESELLDLYRNADPAGRELATDVLRKYRMEKNIPNTAI